MSAYYFLNNRVHNFNIENLKIVRFCWVKISISREVQFINSEKKWTIEQLKKEYKFVGL